MQDDSSSKKQTLPQQSKRKEDVAHLDTNDNQSLPPTLTTTSNMKSSDSVKSPPKKKNRTTNDIQSQQYPVQPSMIQLIKKPKNFVNHTYRDFSNVPIPHGQSFDIPIAISEMSFMLKVHYMISTEMKTLHNSIAWCTHGRAIQINNGDYFEGTGLMPRYFGCNHIKKFQKLLRIHGFKEITKGPDAGCVYSEFCLQGLPHLTVYAPEPKERRKLLPDPENEPDFYKISELFPLQKEPVDRTKEAVAALAARGIVISDNPVNSSSGNSSCPLHHHRPSPTAAAAAAAIPSYNLMGHPQRSIPFVDNNYRYGLNVDDMIAAAASSRAATASAQFPPNLYNQILFNNNYNRDIRDVRLNSYHDLHREIAQGLSRNHNIHTELPMQQLTTSTTSTYHGRSSSNRQSNDTSSQQNDDQQQATTTDPQTIAIMLQYQQELERMSRNRR